MIGHKRSQVQEGYTVGNVLGTLAWLDFGTNSKVAHHFVQRCFRTDLASVSGATVAASVAASVATAVCERSTTSHISYEQSQYSCGVEDAAFSPTDLKHKNQSSRREERSGDVKSELEVPISRTTKHPVIDDDTTLGLERREDGILASTLGATEVSSTRGEVVPSKLGSTPFQHRDACDEVLADTDNHDREANKFHWFFNRRKKESVTLADSSSWDIGCSEDQLVIDAELASVVYPSVSRGRTFHKRIGVACPLNCNGAELGIKEDSFALYPCVLQDAESEKLKFSRIDILTNNVIAESFSGSFAEMRSPLKGDFGSPGNLHTSGKPIQIQQSASTSSLRDLVGGVAGRGKDIRRTQNTHSKSMTSLSGVQWKEPDGRNGHSILSMAPGSTDILKAFGIPFSKSKEGPFASDSRSRYDFVCYHCNDVSEVNVGFLSTTKPSLVVLPFNNDSILKASVVKMLEDAGMLGDSSVVILHQRCAVFSDVIDFILELGSCAGVPDLAKILVEQLRRRLRRLASATACVSVKPRIMVLTVTAMEGAAYGRRWVLSSESHCLSEMIALAGCVVPNQPDLNGDILAVWNHIVSYSPQIIVFTHPNLPPNQVVQCTADLSSLPGWWSIPAVKTGQVYAVHNKFVLRPGPKLVDGIFLIARFAHQDLRLRKDFVVEDGTVLKLSLHEGQRCRHTLLPNYFIPWR